MGIRGHGPEQLRAHVQGLTRDLENLSERTPQEIGQHITELVQRTLHVVNGYQTNPVEHSLFARVHILGQLNEVLNRPSLTNFQEVQAAKALVNQFHVNALARYEAAWEPLRVAGEEDLVGLENTPEEVFIEAAFLLEVPIKEWQSKDLDGGHLSIMQRALTRDLEVFIENLPANTPNEDQALLQFCLGICRSSRDLSVELFNIEHFYISNLTFVPIPDRINNIVAGQIFGLSGVYAMEKDGIDVATRELIKFIENKIEDTVFKIQTKIKNLDVGEECVIPGGFIGGSAYRNNGNNPGISHANLYHVERVEQGLDLMPRYTLTIIDDGWGTEAPSKYYNKYLGQQPHDIPPGYAYDKALLNMTEDQVLNGNMWTELLKPQVVFDQEVSGQNHITLTLLNSAGRESFERGPLHQIYGGSGCSFRPTLLWLQRKLSPETYMDFEDHVKRRVLTNLTVIKTQIANGDQNMIDHLANLTILESDGTTQDGHYVLKLLSETLETDLDIPDSSSDSDSMSISESDLTSIGGVTYENDDDVSSSDDDMDSSLESNDN